MSATHASHVRREVRHLPAGDETVVWYRRAVAHMRARPDDDPTSWSYQAAIHGTPSLQTHPLFNRCRHATWFFLPWHRMFLYFFEQIVRAAVVELGGPHSWALPYWNYGLGGRFATLPQPFRRPQVGGHRNALHTAQRDPGINGGAAIPHHTASPAHALARPRFTGVAQFGGGITAGSGQVAQRTGRLEQTPHNDVHVFVDGWMGFPETAAQDPIFWLHHANIDRLWAVWTGQGRHDPTDHRWREQEFSFFDQHGHRVSMRCRNVLDTAHDLHYTYDPAPAPAHVAAPAPAAAPVSDEGEPELRLVGATDRPTELTAAGGSVAVPVDAQARGDAVAAAPEPSIVLAVEDIEAEAQPGIVWGVYVDLPEGAPDDVAELHHAGNLSLFGIERARHPVGDEQPHGLDLHYDITEIARALERQGRWDPAQVQVTFRPLGLIPPEDPEGEEVAAAAAEDAPPPPAGGPVTLGRVAVYYE